MDLCRIICVAVFLLYVCDIGVTATTMSCSSRAFLERRDNVYSSCYLSRSATRVTWHLKNKSGSLLLLGVCSVVGPTPNCTSSYNTTLMSLRTQQGYRSVFQRSSLTFKRIDPRFEGNLTCEETMNNNTVSTASCPIRVVRVRMSSSHYSFLETNSNSRYTSRRNVYFQCYNSPYTPSSVTWSMQLASGQVVSLGRCSSVSRCTSSSSSSVVTRLYNYRSKVTIANVTRDTPSQLFCAFQYQGQTYTDTATLNVYSQPYSNCSVDFQRQNWTLTIFCNITHMFSSTGTYNYSVAENGRMNISSSESRGFTRLVFPNTRPVPSLVRYTNASDSKIYYRTRLSHSWSLSPMTAKYSVFYVNVNMGRYSRTFNFRVRKEMIVVPPAVPVHNCSSLRYLPEAGPVPCVCSAPSLGRPPGRLRWLVGDAVIATGEYGVASLAFPPDRVSRRNDGDLIQCQVDWIESENVTVTNHVAYGPDCVGLKVQDSYNATGSRQNIVTCHVSEMKPMTAGMVVWDGPGCQGQEGYLCTLTPQPEGSSQLETVTCTVVNVRNNGRNASASLDLTSDVLENDFEAIECPVPVQPAGPTAPLSTPAPGIQCQAVEETSAVSKVNWVIAGWGTLLLVEVIIGVIVYVAAKRFRGFNQGSFGRLEVAFKKKEPMKIQQLYKEANESRDKVADLSANAGPFQVYQNSGMEKEQGHM